MGQLCLCFEQAKAPAPCNEAAASSIIAAVRQHTAPLNALQSVQVAMMQFSARIRAEESTLTGQHRGYSSED